MIQSQNRGGLRHLSHTIFFSWQSDRPTREGRNFIERALEIAVTRIAEDLEVEEPLRDALQVDKDTTGVAGSPPIFQTILGKIDRASVFLADLTFCGLRPDDSPTPNPNVLIEYGWALKALGHSQLLAVMNIAYGRPTRASLPFDLASFRFPITYELPDNALEEMRQRERGQLAQKLETALRQVFESEEFKAKLPKTPEPTLFRRKDPMNGRARFRARGQDIGLAIDPITNEERPVVLGEGPAMWLRVMPMYDQRRSWLSADLKPKAVPLSTVPMMQIPTSIGFVRGEDGCGYYRGFDVDANCVAYVFNTGELCIVNSSVVGASQYVLFEESIFFETLNQCCLFLDRLGCTRPYRWVAGMEGLHRRHLVSNSARRTIGPCLADVIEEEGTYAKDENAAGLLAPFFEKIFDKCGARRTRGPSRDT